MKRSRRAQRSTFGSALVLAWCLLSVPSALAAAPVFERAPRFEAFKARAAGVPLHRFLYGMPQGGDLPHHPSVGAFP